MQGRFLSPSPKLPDLNPLLARFVAFDRVSLVFLHFLTEFYRVSANLNKCYQVLLGFTGFYWVLPGFTGFYRVLVGFSGF